jgi:Glycosyl transferases group 1
MIEAMACGTPVLAYRAGAVVEVIDEGITGMIVDNLDQACIAAAQVASLDRRRVRRRFEERFTAHRMAKDYLRVYRSRFAAQPERIVNGGRCANGDELVIDVDQSTERKFGRPNHDESAAHDEA